MSQLKTKKCQSCDSKFTIEPEDFKFYEKIQVPEPTFCPECRMRRRFLWRNESKLYKRKCDFSGEEIFSGYSKSAPVTVFDTDIWWSDKWDPMEYGRDYDFSRPFFEQFAELLGETPVPSRTIVNLINSDYCMNSGDLKNCYFLFNAGVSEDCLYGVDIDMSKDSVDNYFLTSCELCYQSVMLANCFKAFFSSHCDDCQEIIFCRNCVDCSDCFGCVNLKHKKYHIFNKAYSKEKYFEKIKEFNIGSYQNKEEIAKVTKDLWLKNPIRFRYGRKNKNVSGEYIFNSKNVKNSYMIKGGEDLKYCQSVRFRPSAKDCYDYTGIGRGTELSYEDIIVGRGASRIKFSINSYENIRDFDYCFQCVSSSDLFGCVSLRKKQYCILNKQYTKEEYEKMIPRIKQHMNEMPYKDKKERVYKYGEFFPSELSPFAYNETTTQEYFPITEKEALEQGYSWRNKPKNNYELTLKTEDLPDHIEDAKESLSNEIIECSNKDKNQCRGSGVFKMIPAELKFYQKQGVPLPRLCPDCRHHQRIKQRNPIKLFKRKCMCNGEKDQTKTYQNQNNPHQSHKPTEACPNTFQTSYSPERKEIVYCEECYQREVE